MSTTTGITGLTTSASGNPDRPHSPVDLSSRAFWSGTMRERDASFARLRAEEGITWHAPFQDQLVDDPADYGFWAITRHADLAEVTKRHEEFLSGPGILMENLPAAAVEAAQSIIGMDPPRHTRLRRLVASAFTPRQMRRIEGHIADNAAAVVDNLILKAADSGGEVDFVAECAAILPMHNINDIVGVPAGDREKAAHEAMVGTSWNDPEIMGGSEREVVLTRLFEALLWVHDLVLRLVEERRREPTDDLLTALVHAEVDGERLTDDEISAFFLLLTIAGNDTTRQSASHGVRALTDHPDQRAWLTGDLEARLPSAIEELVRWATPIMTFRRTASRDVDFHGQQITEGDKVVLFYSSANRDERVWADPWTFDLSRDPNPHVAFGGGGIHHCLGTHLARTQLRSLYRELMTRVPGIEAGEPVLTPGNFFHIVKAMPVRLDPRELDAAVAAIRARG